MTPRPLRVALIASALIVLTVGTYGCSTPVRPLERTIAAPAPIADSPAGALRLLEWAFNHRSIEALRGLLTDDFRFNFNARDSAGADYRTQPWTREDELISAQRLFFGGGDDPPAASIALQFDRNFVVLPDPRHVAADPLGRWHKVINTQVLLDIRFSDGGAVSISGQAIFYFARGDSALIPQELLDRGVAPDSTGWCIQRWDDETVGGVGGLSAGAHQSPSSLAAQPLKTWSWGSIKVVYRDAPPAADASRAVAGRRTD